nr:hypothetical protein MEP434_gp23 [Methylophilales phage MEP434]
MCMPKPKRPTPAPAPVRSMSPVGEELIPTLKTAEEDTEIKRKKKKAKKSGTSSLMTSGLGIPTKTSSSGIATS